MNKVLKSLIEMSDVFRHMPGRLQDYYMGAYVRAQIAIVEVMDDTQQDAEFAKMRQELSDSNQASPTLVLAQTECDCKAFQADAVDLAKAIIHTADDMDEIDAPIVAAAKALIAKGCVK